MFRKKCAKKKPDALFDTFILIIYKLILNTKGKEVQASAQLEYLAC